MNTSRRSFLSALACAGAASAAPRLFARSPADYDDALSVLISDVHVSGEPGTPTYHQDRLRKVVAAILKMSPLPKRVICFGDLAWNHGTRKDYAASKPLLQPLVDAGIELTIGMGNHDNRIHFAEYWPDHVKRSRVVDRFVTVVNGPHCDFIMTDSLHQGTDWNVMGPVDGHYEAAQKAWLEENLPKWPRPVFVCAHHPFGEIETKGKPLLDLYLESPNVVGYLYGHNHHWLADAFRQRVWHKTAMKRQLCLPSTGHWGDIGFVTFRTTPKTAEARLVIDDYYFPAPVPAAERDPIWDDFVAERRGAWCRFNLPKA